MSDSASDGHISVDETANDSALDSVAESEISTESLASSIYEYRFENGRRYHAYKDGKYLAPNDETEQDRLDIVHHINLLMLGGNLLTAPIPKDPQMILDIGTGTGIWAIDAGEKYPSAKVIGTDLSPIQPNWVPPNVEFQIDDAEQEWTWPKNHFDLVHIRNLNGAIKDWNFLLKEAYRTTKPGGWVDITEYDFHLYSDDGTFHKDLSMYKYYDLVNKAADKSGRPFGIASHIAPILEACGFEEIRVKMMKLPLGTWPADQKLKEIGAFFTLAAETGFEALGTAYLTRVLGMEVEDVNDLLREIMKEIKNRKIHAYGRQYFYSARKPLNCDE
ncbi:uncharacterized protein H6S33_004490 [Morchella sextelata]|uniref:uncharacterized protein n=1 Tax=Morchella sextelata TaxID=1174677 RepID=UPI001D03F856|nr:uncharacterized protein H6S33_004490 [Morchella sextelata]KAH0606033.1 hypothetical protein H6S33_004490 [Morchella sextelata]